MKRHILFLFAALSALLASRAEVDVSPLVGNIDVNAMVSESGGAVVSIPIDVPSGINGFQPELSLVYNSQGGLGTAGWGWSLNGVSAITRTGSDMHHDGTVAGINFTSEDNLLLGGQRLMLYTGTNFNAGAVYHTEVETFDKITYRPTTGCDFKIQSKEGTVTTYSNSSSCQLAYGTDVLTWYPSVMMDNNGNAINYTYAVTSTPYAETLLSTISYAGDDIDIEFIYTDMPHPRTSYYPREGSSTPFIAKDTKMLTRIDVKAHDQLLYSYILSYDQSGTVPHLTSVKKEASNGDAYPPTAIAWETSSTVTSYATTSVSAAKKENCLRGDFNGDGKADMLTYTAENTNAELYINTSYGTTVSYQHYDVTLAHEYDELHMLDFNGDGKTDIVGKYGTYLLGDTEICCELSNGSGFTPSSLGWGADYTTAILTGDYDGDGMDEILISSEGVILHHGSTFAYYSGIAESLKDNFIFRKKRNIKSSMDFNGNGKEDIFVATADDAFVYELNDDGYTFTKISSFDFSANDYGKCDKKSFAFGDYNGDGKTDFIYYGKRTSLGDVLSAPIRFSTGRGFVSGSSVYHNVSLDNVCYLQSCDVNHDGLSDVAYVLKNSTTPSLYVRTFNGSGFSSQSFSLGGLTSSSIDNYLSSFAVADIFGNGRAEFTCFKTSTQVYTHRLFSENPQLVKDITSTIGTDIHFTYLPLTSYSVYGSYGNYSFPYFEGRMPLYVVWTHTEPYVSETYKYRGCMMHRQGKGFMGYYETTVTDNLNNRKSVTTRELNTNYKCLYAANVTIATLDGINIESTDYTYAFRNINGFTNYFPYVSETTHVDHLTTISETEELLYNNNGNLTYRDYTKGDLGELSSYTYVNAGSWCPNKLSSVTTYHSLTGTSTVSRTTNYTYDSHGNKTREVNDPSVSTLTLTSQYAYDSRGNLLSETVSGSGQTRVTTYTYGTSGRFPTSKTDELGMTTSYNYDETTGLLTSQTDNTGTTTYTYDTMGRLLSTAHPDGVVESKSWQLVENGTHGVAYTEMDYCTGKAPVTTYYNSAGIPLCQRKIGFQGRSVYTAYGYNANGSRQFVSDPFFCSTYSDALTATFTDSNAECYTYDAFGRLLTVNSPSVSKQYAYNGLTTQCDVNGQMQITALNNVGWVADKTLTVCPINILTVDSLLRTPPATINSQTIQYTYYPTGNVKSITPTGSGTISLEYDLHGNRTKMVDPDAGTVTDSYNAFDQHTSHSHNIHGAGQVQTTYAYDTASGRLLSETVVGNDNSSKQYAYHAQFKDLVSCITDQEGNHVSYSYDSKGRLIREERTSDGPTLADTYAYSGGHITQHGYIVDNVTKTLENFTYDGLGNMIRESLVNNSSNIWELLETNARGQVLRERKGSIVTTYTYDNAGRVLTISAPGIQNLTYTYDENGNTLTKEDAIANHKAYYSYDGMNRLTSWRTESPYPHSLLDSNSSLRLPPPITNITHTITYDEETGNIIGKSDLGSNATFTYDPTNKPHALRSVSNVATDWGSDTQDITYTDLGMVESIEMGDDSYDIQYAADGRRIKSHLLKGDGGFTTRYYGNGLEKAISGVDNIDYLTYLCHGAIVVHHEGSGGALRAAPPTTPTAILQAYYDAQGSMVALADNSGNVIARFAYDPWGKRVNPTDWTQSATSTEPYHINRGYTMHEHLDDFGLINMNGRVFDPASAQFLSPDNYVQAEGNWLNYNRYVYCLNNPLKYVDPSGEIFSTVFTFACDLVHSVGKSLFFDIPQGDWDALKNTWREFDPSSPSSRTAKAWKIDMGWFQTDHNLSTGKQVWQVISRFTWELPQSLLGYCAMTGYNVIGQVDQVDYLGGATFCVDENREKYSDKKSNFALGSFIHTQMHGSINGPFDRMVCKNPSFMHEYGHYLQSKREGLSYLVIGAVPSLCSLIAGHINKNHIHTHFSVEKRASTLAAHYFYTYYGVDWYNTIYQTSDPNYHHLIVTDYPTF